MRKENSGARPGSGTGTGRPIMCEALTGDTGIPPERKVLSGRHSLMSLEILYELSFSVNSEGEAKQTYPVLSCGLK